MSFNEVVSTDDPAVDVVFVHGLRMFFPTPETDWQSGGSRPRSLWPQWLREELPTARIATVSYPAAASNWFGTSMHLEDRAANILATLRAHGIGDRPVIFVTHSLGGLVVKELLLQSASAADSDEVLVARACRGVVFIATPHDGSAIADRVRRFRWLRSGNAIETLLRNNPHLRHLSQRYRDWASRHGQVQHLVLSETRPVGGAALVVDASSSDPGIPFARALLTESNHVDIVRPGSRAAFVYEQVARFLKEITTNPGFKDSIPRVLTRESVSAASRQTRSASSPDILPSMAREDLVATVTSEPHAMQVVFGEGGLGKSVLAGQLFDAVSRDREVVFIACSMLRESQRSDDVDAIDAALGSLIGGAGQGLSSILEDMPGRPVLVIDTLDLILDQKNGSEIAALLSRLSDRSDVIVTCRAREWHDLLAPFTDRIDVKSHAISPLNREQVLDWVDAYLANEPLSEADASVFRISIEASLDVRRGLAVLGVPLRLAMACRLYATAGGLPENLTATRLYQEYWSSRVSAERSGRHNTEVATAKERAAMRVAATIWRQSEQRFIEDVAPIDDVTSSNELVSEGVISRTGGRLHFFHQTFAEFAVAKHLGVVGTDEDLERLGAGLRAKTSGYWGVVSHLVLQELPISRFNAIWSLIPLELVEGTRAGLVGALTIADTERGADLLRLLVAQHPAQVSGATDLLDDIPDRHVAVVVSLLISLVESIDRNLTAVLRTLAGLILRLPSSEAALSLAGVLDRLIARHRNRDPLIASDIQRFLAMIFTDEPGRLIVLLPPVLNRYSALPVPGRRVVCGTIDVTDQVSREKFLDVALRHPVPSDSVDNCVSAMIAEWNDPASRRRRGWNSWQGLLGLNLPSLWDAVQVRVVGSTTTTEHTNSLITECLRPRLGLPRDRLVNATLFHAVRYPAAVCAAIVCCGVDSDRVSIAALSQMVLQIYPSLTASQASSIIDILLPVSHIEPRRSWPAIAKAATVDSLLLARVLDQVADESHDGANGSARSAPIESLVDALPTALGPGGLRIEWPTINRFLARVDGTQSARLVGLWGAMAYRDSDARKRVDSLFDSDRFRDQKRITVALLEAFDDLTQAERAGKLSWTASLLRTRNDGVVVRLAAALLADAASPSWSATETDIIVDRIEVALRRGDDPQTSGSLVNVLATIAHDAPAHAHPTIDQVQSVVGNYHDFLDASIRSKVRSPRLSALYVQYADLLRRVVRPVLGLDAMSRESIALLVDYDTAAIAEGARRTLAKTLSALVRGAPEQWILVERQWSAVSQSNKWAIAETVINGLISDRDGTALRLASRPDCPPDVAAYLLRRSVP